MDECTKRKITVKALAFSDIGPNRSQNQDAIVLGNTVGVGQKSQLSWVGEIKEPVIFAVIDGMGGYAGGSDAAAIVATSIANANPYVEGVEANNLFNFFSEKVTKAGEAWGTPSMGATFASLSIGDEGCIFLNVGDCRSYKIDGGFVGQMSIDDRVSEESSTITQAIGGGMHVDAHAWRQDLPLGKTRYLLCTDGAWASISQDDLISFGDSDMCLETVIDTMIEDIYENDASDNCSAIIVEVFVEGIEGLKGE